MLAEGCTSKSATNHHQQREEGDCHYDGAKGFEHVRPPPKNENDACPLSGPLHHPEMDRRETVTVNKAELGLVLKYS